VFARVETFQASPEGMEQLISGQQHTVALARQLPGNMGGYLLVNRESCKALSVTYWENEEDREAAESEFRAAPITGEVELYAIAMQEALNPT
jgi:heme-degrading monooxygenase HmoA